MSEQKKYRIDEIKAILGISQTTITKWYDIQKVKLKNGEITEPYLPNYERSENEVGRPRKWTEEGLEQLKEFKANLVSGRNGIYGKYTNPKYVKKKGDKHE